MKELLKNAKPILFNTEMVRAILDGRKTETRRLIKPQPSKGLQFPYGFNVVTRSASKKEIGSFCWTAGEFCHDRVHRAKPPYEKDDILYVRETWQLDPTGFEEIPPEDWWVYKASDELPDTCTKWRPSIHMPKEAARIFLRVNEVRADKLPNMTEEDAESEGIMSVIDGGPHEYGPWKTEPYTLTEAFSWLWDKVYKSRGYEWNKWPWVWVIKFEKVSA